MTIKEILKYKSKCISVPQAPRPKCAADGKSLKELELMWGIKRLEDIKDANEKNRLQIITELKDYHGFDMNSNSFKELQKTHDKLRDETKARQDVLLKELNKISGLKA